MPFDIRVDEVGSLTVLENGEPVGMGDILPSPEWYAETVDGYPITSIVTQHGSQIAASVYEGCALFGKGEECQFCVIDRSQANPDLKKIERKSELIIKALEKIPLGTYQGITLNGGMTFSEARGLEILTPTIERIRQSVASVPIAAEMTPPQDLQWINRFAEVGGNSLMMNLETWDEKTRQELLPGKSKYCPKDSYLRAFEKAIDILGDGKVSTCFVVGTEPLDSLKEGVRSVLDYGVIPSPLAGRFFEQIEDYPFSPNVDWREFVEIFQFVRTEMMLRGLLSTDKAGCVACGMCDIIGDTEF